MTVRNFLSLWNQKQQKEKEQYRQLHEGLEHTKQELEVEKKKEIHDRSETSRTKSIYEIRIDKGRRGSRKGVREDADNEEMIVIGVEDDLEGGHEPIPLHETAALVAGRKLVRSKTSAIFTANDTISATIL